MMKPRRTRSFRILAGGLTLAVVAAACGSDDGASVRNLGGEGSVSAPASGSVSGSSSSPAASNPTGDGSSDGGYDYVSDVSAHRLVTDDVCEIAGLLGTDLNAAEAIYRNGENSVNTDGSVRTLASFAGADGRNHGLDTYYGTPTSLDDWVSEAFSGVGRFAAAGDGVRAQAIEKRIQNQVMVAWTIHELESALAKAADGNFDAADGAPHNWDEAWAFYHGASPACAPYTTADKRAGDFGTTGSGTTAAANEAILEAMNTGHDALVAGDADVARAAADEVVRNLVITYSQASIRYATLGHCCIKPSGGGLGVGRGTQHLVRHPICPAQVAVTCVTGRSDWPRGPYAIA